MHHDQREQGSAENRAVARQITVVLSSPLFEGTIIASEHIRLQSLSTKHTSTYFSFVFLFLTVVLRTPMTV